MIREKERLLRVEGRKIAQGSSRASRSLRVHGRRHRRARQAIYFTHIVTPAWLLMPPMVTCSDTEQPGGTLGTTS
jgi:hypothetical protein